MDSFDLLFLKHLIYTPEHELSNVDCVFGIQLLVSPLALQVCLMQQTRSRHSYSVRVVYRFLPCVKDSNDVSNHLQAKLQQPIISRLVTKCESEISEQSMGLSFPVCQCIQATCHLKCLGCDIWPKLVVAVNVEGEWQIKH